jgi:predicted nucleotidyltransferase
MHVFQKILVRIAQELDSSQLPYMIIGGQAVLLYGEPRATKDIDITLGADIGKLEVVRTMIRNLGMNPAVEEAEAFVQRHNVLPVVDEESGIRIDFIFSFTPYERQAIQRANRVKIENREVAYASVEDIIIHKLVAGRPRDIEDVKSILNHQSRYDVAYVELWLQEFSNALGRGLVLEFQELRKTQGT